jgi:hypothetical protein
MDGLGSTQALIGSLISTAVSIGGALVGSGSFSVGDAAKAASNIAVSALTPTQRAQAAAVVVAPQAAAPTSTVITWAIPTGVLVAVGGIGAYLLLKKK